MSCENVSEVLQRSSHRPNTGQQSLRGLWRRTRWNAAVRSRNTRRRESRMKWENRRKLNSPNNSRTYKPGNYPPSPTVTDHLQAKCYNLLSLFNRRLSLQERVNKYKIFEEFLMKTLDLLPDSKNISSGLVSLVFSSVPILLLLWPNCMYSFGEEKFILLSV